MDSYNKQSQDIVEPSVSTLHEYPYIDTDLALLYLNNNKTLLLSMMKTFFLDDMPTEKYKLNTAFAEKDWGKIEKLIHKIMGGITYLGLVKMQYACQQLDIYFQTQQTQQLPALYQQFSQCFDETQHAIQQWLEQELDHHAQDTN